jgi:hypothetical protein
MTAGKNFILTINVIQALHTGTNPFRSSSSSTADGGRRREYLLYCESVSMVIPASVKRALSGRVAHAAAACRCATETIGARHPELVRFLGGREG